ncbi:hypothetical protein TELCIR_02874 [Teladorsagia circumcincta]|uniref:Uncharacterized protein n=1 Tax=Teladorsagia circumcincta TaxID=45464 RepID=A0A2G9UXX7_TELCI|nr:hypothetical protein TELCIR_02874 [Teladorsagia circumcincta]
MTPVDRGSLARTESDQDHLEFSHPYFIRDHPEFLVNIKRKQCGLPFNAVAVKITASADVLSHMQHATLDCQRMNT